MEDLDPELCQALQAREEARYDDALRGLLAATGRVLGSDAAARSDEFMTMLEWRLLAEAYAPAREALARVRDEQAGRLMHGDFDFASGRDRPGLRFAIIVRMNGILGDPQASSTLFARLEALAPEQARRVAFLALPALVATGDFARAETYLPQHPLQRIGYLHDQALRFPLFPPDRSAPRLATELLNFMRDVRLCAATWEGLGRQAEAHALRADALARLPSDEMRTLAERELAEPDTIIREIVARQMALDDAGVA